MKPTVDSVLDQAMELSVEDRQRLVDLLISDLDSRIPFRPDPELLAECRRRSERIKSGEEKTYTWEEVRDGARKRIGVKGGD